MWHTHADGLVRQVAEHPEEFTLAGFYDPDPKVVAERRRQWPPKIPNFRVFDSPEQLLREPFDGIVVEGRVHDNLKWARLALESGRPVLLEKPAGTDLAEYRRLIDLAQRKHLHMQMLYLFRYMSAVLQLIQRVRKGELGRIYAFRARLPKDLASYSRFVEELRPYKGGMFFEMAGHVIDVMVALLGCPQRITPFLAHHHVGPPPNYVDNGVAVFAYPHAWAIVEVPALEVAPHSRRIEVYGTEGACVIPHLGSGHLANKEIQPIEVYRAGDAGWNRIDLPARVLQISDLREFAACIAGKKPPEYGMEHDLIVQETLLRASGMV
ncbi:MAG TPA: Gfo/Idh/MocA family oxidoreductase [Gemmataceae bacterium]|nr:Gfo/Idh/MocA family oxidoreductase [Gemmataceae bacterium]